MALDIKPAQALKWVNEKKNQVLALRNPNATEWLFVLELYLRCFPKAGSKSKNADYARNKYGRHHHDRLVELHKTLESDEKMLALLAGMYSKTSGEDVWKGMDTLFKAKKPDKDAVNAPAYAYKQKANELPPPPLPPAPSQPDAPPPTQEEKKANELPFEILPATPREQTMPPVSPPENEAEVPPLSIPELTVTPPLAEDVINNISTSGPSDDKSDRDGAKQSFPPAPAEEKKKKSAIASFFVNAAKGASEVAQGAISSTANAAMNMFKNASSPSNPRLRARGGAREKSPQVDRSGDGDSEDDESEEDDASPLEKGKGQLTLKETLNRKKKSASTPASALVSSVTTRSMPRQSIPPNPTSSSSISSTPGDNYDGGGNADGDGTVLWEDEKSQSIPPNSTPSNPATPITPVSPNSIPPITSSSNSAPAKPTLKPSPSLMKTNVIPDYVVPRDRVEKYKKVEAKAASFKKESKEHWEEMAELETLKREDMTDAFAYYKAVALLKQEMALMYKLLMGSNVTFRFMGVKGGQEEASLLLTFIQKYNANFADDLLVEWTNCVKLIRDQGRLYVSPSALPTQEKIDNSVTSLTGNLEGLPLFRVFDTLDPQIQMRYLSYFYSSHVRAAQTVSLPIIIPGDADLKINDTVFVHRMTKLVETNYPGLAQAVRPEICLVYPDQVVFYPSTRHHVFFFVMSDGMTKDEMDMMPLFFADIESRLEDENAYIQLIPIDIGPSKAKTKYNFSSWKNKQRARTSRCTVWHRPYQTSDDSLLDLFDLAYYLRFMLYDPKRSKSALAQTNGEWTTAQFQAITDQAKELAQACEETALSFANDGSAVDPAFSNADNIGSAGVALPKARDLGPKKSGIKAEDMFTPGAQKK